MKINFNPNAPPRIGLCFFFFKVFNLKFNLVELFIHNFEQLQLTAKYYG